MFSYMQIAFRLKSRYFTLYIVTTVDPFTVGYSCLSFYPVLKSFHCCFIVSPVGFPYECHVWAKMRNWAKVRIIALLFSCFWDFLNCKLFLQVCL